MQSTRDLLTMRIRDQRGFTLVELMMVMVIIGVLAGLGFTGFNALQTRSARTQADVYWRDLSTAVQMYRIEYNGLPDYEMLIKGDPGEGIAPYLDDSAKPWSEATTVEFERPETGDPLWPTVGSAPNERPAQVVVEIRNSGVCVWVLGNNKAVGSGQNDLSTCTIKDPV